MSQVLFVQLSRFGDCLQSTPLLASWRRRHPRDRIVVLVRELYSPVYFRNPDVDEVLVFEPPLNMISKDSANPLETLRALKRWVGALKERQFRAVVNLTHDSFSSWLVAALAPAEWRGLAINRSAELRTEDPWSCYTLSLLKFRKSNLLNIADAYAHYSGGKSILDSPLFQADPASRKRACELLGDRADHPCIVGFQPGANKPERRWPVEYFIQLGQRLVAEPGAAILVFGTKDEEGLAAKIVEGIAGATNFAGTTDIPHLAALLRHCKVLVTNDTGTMHLAAAVGTRIVALFEASAYFRETGPYGTGHWILQSADILDYGERGPAELGRIQRIPVEEVFYAVRSMLRETTEAGPGALPECSLTQYRAAHYRSIWSEGHLDFYPVQASLVDDALLRSYLQKPVWLASLDRVDFDARDEALRIMEFLRLHFVMPSVSHFSKMIEALQAEIQVSAASIGRMRNAIQAGLDQLSRNPHSVISEDRISELNALEKSALHCASLPGVQPFVAYFEASLAMVGGETTLQYLQSYLRPVLFLENQLQLFNRILNAARVLHSERGQATGAGNL